MDEIMENIHGRKLYLGKSNQGKWVGSRNQASSQKFFLGRLT